jgi:hypothetical protein
MAMATPMAIPMPMAMAMGQEVIGATTDCR